jgi:DNA polymerase I-like protein with 3'-5' exonuclease and polymerase domains
MYQLVKSHLQLVKYKVIRNSIVDGKIYSHWYDNGTKTGRITSRDFNVQGLPKVCRPFVVADKGCKIVTADYSNIELRLLADFSGDVNLLNAFEHGEDVHKLTASKVFEKPPSEVTDVERGVAKKINFGVVYGVTSMGLQRMLMEDLQLETTQEQAQGYIDSFYCAYPRLRPYFQEVLSAEGYKHIENPRSRMNYPIQHGCAVGFKGSIVRLYESMPKSWRIICLLHDEIALQVPSNDVEQARTLLEKSMVEGMKTVSPNVNISVDIAVGDSWIKC